MFAARSAWQKENAALPGQWPSSAAPCFPQVTGCLPSTLAEDRGVRPLAVSGAGTRAADNAFEKLGPSPDWQEFQTSFPKWSPWYNSGHSTRLPQPKGGHSFRLRRRVPRTWIVANVLNLRPLRSTKTSPLRRALPWADFRLAVRLEPGARGAGIPEPSSSPRGSSPDTRRHPQMTSPQPRKRR